MSLPIFCYGSNMFTERLRRRAPSARGGTRATLGKHRLTFHKRGRDGSGKCTIQPSRSVRHVVHGVLFRIDAQCLDGLHRAEGLGAGYEFIRVRVTTVEGERVAAHAYRAIPEAIDRKLVPFEWYRTLVVQGALEHALPEWYTRRILTIRCVRDRDMIRARRNRRLLVFASPKGLRR